MKVRTTMPTTWSIRSSQKRARIEELGCISDDGPPPRPSSKGSSQHHEKALSGRPSILHDRILAMPTALVTQWSIKGRHPKTFTQADLHPAKQVKQ
jgi:hypothetical protein